MIKKIGIGIAALALVMSAGALQADAAPNWDVSGDWDIGMEYLGSTYTHEVTFAQDADGDLDGTGGYPAGGPLTFEWDIVSGEVEGDAIMFTANYTAPADASTTVMTASGTIAADGTMSGTWMDNYGGGSRAGSWESTLGMATSTDDAELAAEDFGVVNYDTGLGMLKGYTAGFGLTDAELADIDTVVVRLYSGATLLQTNTGTDEIADLPGSQFSSPFDVFGTFDYEEDGYWVNDRESEYGQTLIPTRVVATVTLDDGTVLTAENTTLTGDPADIFPTDPGDAPTNKDQCKNGGWMNFTNPSFRNQGQCVSYVNTH